MEKTSFLTWKNGTTKEETKKTLLSGTTLVPYSAENNLLTHKVVLLPSGVEEYESQQVLIRDIRGFIHRYLDISERFEAIASYYVLFSWVHDDFNELPYLRARGDYGSGKSRFLQTVGSLCFKPIFACGASTVSPLFRILDAVQGTLVIDEADFKSTDERAEITKILNNGNARGFPVLRSEVTPQKEFDPRAFHVFGPKLIATRNSFEDQALESRCLTTLVQDKSQTLNLEPIFPMPQLPAGVTPLTSRMESEFWRRTSEPVERRIPAPAPAGSNLLPWMGEIGVEEKVECPPSPIDLRAPV